MLMYCCFVLPCAWFLFWFACPSWRMPALPGGCLPVLVGVVPLDKKTSIPEGSHLVKDANAKLPNPKLGHISASCWSVEYNNPFSLAILKDGKNMIGKKLFALCPVKNKSIQNYVVCKLFYYQRVLKSY